MVSRAILGLLLGGILHAQAPDPLAALPAIREYALSYSERMPNYTATQTVKRESKPTPQGRFSMGARSQTQTVEEQISVVEGRELHKILRIDGREVKEWESDSEGMYSRGEFALLLAAIFRPETKTSFHFERSAKLNGRTMRVFGFSVPQLPNGYGIKEGERTLIVPYKGSLWADAETSAVMRIQMNCTDIPPVSQYRGVGITLEYKPTLVAGQEFILPAGYTMSLRRVDSDVTMQATFKNYRRFAADATIIFEEEPQ